MKMVDIEPDDPLLSIKFLKKCGRQYAGDYDLNDPYISPIHGDFKGLPELSVYIGTHDILYPDCCIFEECGIETGNISPSKYYNYVVIRHSCARPTIKPGFCIGERILL